MANKKEVIELDELMLEIMRLRAAGWQQPEIAEKIGLDQSNISRRLEKLRGMNLKFDIILR